MKNVLKKILCGFFGAILLAGYAYGCNTSKLTGSWDFSIQELGGGVTYCNNIRFTRKGYIKRDVGKCWLYDEIPNTDIAAAEVLVPYSGRLVLKSDCTLDKSKARYLRFKVGGEIAALKIEHVMLDSKDFNNILIHSRDTGSSKWPVILIGIKK